MTLIKDFIPERRKGLLRQHVKLEDHFLTITFGFAALMDDPDI